MKHLSALLSVMLTLSATAGMAKDPPRETPSENASIGQKEEQIQKIQKIQKMYKILSDKLLRIFVNQDCVWRTGLFPTKHNTIFKIEKKNKYETNTKKKKPNKKKGKNKHNAKKDTSQEVRFIPNPHLGDSILEDAILKGSFIVTGPREYVACLLNFIYNKEKALARNRICFDTRYFPAEESPTGADPDTVSFAIFEDQDAVTAHLYGADKKHVLEGNKLYEELQKQRKDLEKLLNKISITPKNANTHPEVFTEENLPLLRKCAYEQFDIYSDLFARELSALDEVRRCTKETVDWIAEALVKSIFETIAADTDISYTPKPPKGSKGVVVDLANIVATMTQTLYEIYVIRLNAKTPLLTEKGRVLGKLLGQAQALGLLAPLHTKLTGIGEKKLSPLNWDADTQKFPEEETLTEDEMKDLREILSEACHLSEEDAEVERFGEKLNRIFAK